MAISKKYNITWGKKYTNREGEQKKQWIPCGSLIQWDDGNYSLQLDALPIGCDGKLSVFEDTKSQKRSAPREAPVPAEHELEDEVPF